MRQWIKGWFFHCFQQSEIIYLDCFALLSAGLAMTIFSDNWLLFPEKGHQAGGYGEESTDDPISNSTLKVLCADDTLA
jgi:hypothetical protein